MSRPTYIHIDLEALRRNLKRVRELTHGAAIMAMVKANAYGHGIKCIANALTEADSLGVASLEEGIILRESGITKRIILMEGLFHPDELTKASQHDFDIIVHHEPQVAMLEHIKLKKPIRIWLKINTGMHRLGINPENFSRLYIQLINLANVQKPIGLMTHFASADLLAEDSTNQQITLFHQLTHELPGPKSLANSAGILAWPTSHADWVRPGLMLYGASPFADRTGYEFGLQPVMSLCSRLIAINKVEKGGKVGYGGTWSAPCDMLVGVVGVGYGDGYPQGARNGTPVIVNGQSCPLVGRVSMDMLTVDLVSQPNAKVDDPVILFGKELPVELVAQNNHTSAYEILTRMTQRPPIKISG